MHASAILTLGAAALAAAAPAAEHSTKPTFQVTNFVYGCTSGCYWNFDLSIPNSNNEVRPATKSVHCSGSLEQQDFVTCGAVGDNKSLSAYITKADNTLNVKYEYSVPAQTARYDYFGMKTVFSATNDPNHLQKSDFKVPQTSATAVA